MGACAGRERDDSSASPGPRRGADKPQSVDQVEAASGGSDATTTTGAPAAISSHYALGEELGRGGFSIVYEARALRDDGPSQGRDVAVKVIGKDAVDSEESELLRREIDIMREVDHPYILRLYDVFEDDDAFYLVIELVRGRELFDEIVDRGRYSEREAADILRKILEAVCYLHKRGIAHRDLKPENVLAGIDADGQPTLKIADFGFAKQFDDENLMTSCGSPGYVAPEVLSSDTYDKSVDMWSVGVILYILLCGYPPFYADSPPALFKKIMDIDYDFDDPAWVGVSDVAKDLVRELLVREPSDRLTAEECLEHEWVSGGAASTAKLELNLERNKTWRPVSFVAPKGTGR